MLILSSFKAKSVPDLLYSIRCLFLIRQSLCIKFEFLVCSGFSPDVPDLLCSIRCLFLIRQSLCIKSEFLVCSGFSPDITLSGWLGSKQQPAN